MKKPLIYLFAIVYCIAFFSITAPLLAQDTDDVDKNLITSIMRGDLDGVEDAIRKGADVNKKGKQGFTPYEAARRTGFKQITDLLVAKGAKTDIQIPSATEYVKSMLSEDFDDSSPACVVLLSQDGKILLQEAFGRSDIAKKKSATIDTKFRIGSVTKQFTAAAILKLEEEGRVSVEDKLSKYFPEFPRGDEVTLRHLLTHTSGIVSYTSKSNFWMTNNGGVTELEIVDMIKNDEFDFEPGEKYSYCNTGYVMLGFIVGKVTDSSLDTYLKQAFFEPLGMKNTGIHRPGLNLKNEANGYSFNEGEWELKNLKDMSWAAGAGAMYSTVGDLNLWNEALFANQVLKKKTLDRAFKPTKLKDGSISNYGYGWMLGDYRGLKRIEHGGGLPGFLTHLVRYPDSKTTIAVFVSCLPSGDLPPPGLVAKNVANAFLSKSMEQRKVLLVDKSVDAKTYNDYVGEYDYGSATMAVSVEDGKIYAQLTGQAKLEIYPKDATTFFWKVVDAQVEFQRGEDGKVVRAVHTQNGTTQNAPRLEQGFKVDPKVLAKYAGRYDYGSGAMTVTADGTSLFAQITGQARMRIYPTSETNFEWRVVKASVEFVAGDDGEIEKVIHTQNGRSFDAAKMDLPVAINVATEKLDEYVGRYNLGLLVGKMVITREGDKMFGKLASQPKLEILPTAEDELSWVDVAATMKFIRDEDGKIIRGDFTQGGRTFKAKRLKSEADNK